MTHEEWWYEIGSGMPPRIGEDAHEHVQRVIAVCWPAARAAIYEAEAAQLTEPLRAKIKSLELAEEGAKEAFGHVMQQKRDLEAECKKLRGLLDSAHEIIRSGSKGPNA